MALGTKRENFEADVASLKNQEVGTKKVLGFDPQRSKTRSRVQFYSPVSPSLVEAKLAAGPD